MTERQWMGLCLACNDAGLTTDLAVKLQVLELIEEEMEAEPSLPHRMMLLDAGNTILDQLAESITKRRSHLDDLAHGQPIEMVSENQMVSDTLDVSLKTDETECENGEKCIEN